MNQEQAKTYLLGLGILASVLTIIVAFLLSFSELSDPGSNDQDEAKILS